MTGKAFLEAGLVVKVFERHEPAVQALATRARALGAPGLGTEQSPLKDLEQELDEFVQTVLRDLQQRHHSD